MNFLRVPVFFCLASVILVTLGIIFYPTVDDFCYDHFSSGDVIGTIQVVQDDGSVVSLRTGGDTLHYFGRRINSSDLLSKFDRSTSDFHSYEDPFRNKRYWREKYKLDMEANLLIESKNPKIFERLTKLLDDPLFTNFAIERLIEMRDSRACPYILASWNDANKNNDMFVVAFRTFPFKPAVPRVIDSLRESYECEDPDFILVTIEKTSGHSLEAFRYMRNSTPAEVRELKAKLLSWWKQYNGEVPTNGVASESPTTTFNDLGQALAFIDQKLDQEDWKGLESALYPPLEADEQSRTLWQQLKSDRGQGRLAEIFKDLYFPSDDETYGYPYNKDVFALGASNNAEARLKGVSRITFLKTDSGWRLKSVSKN